MIVHFILVIYDSFLWFSELESKEDFKVRMREVVQTLPRPVFIVMRYLFSFLNQYVHLIESVILKFYYSYNFVSFVYEFYSLSEYSDENMMDPYNLAICFGPTLVPVPEDKDQVQYQNLVNELIKNVIINSEDIFPNDGGLLYERYISKEPDEGYILKFLLLY